MKYYPSTACGNSYRARNCWATKFPKFNTTTAIKNFYIVICTTPHLSCKTKHWSKGKLDSFVGIWKSNGPFTVKVNMISHGPVWSCEVSTGGSQLSTTTWVRCWWLGSSLSCGWLGGSLSCGWLGCSLSCGGLGGGWLGSGGWLGGGLGGGLCSWNLIYRKVQNMVT